MFLVSLLHYLQSDLNEGDPGGLLLQSKVRSLPSVLTLLGLRAVVLRKRVHLLLPSENLPELAPHLHRRTHVH